MNNAKYFVRSLFCTNFVVQIKDCLMGLQITGSLQSDLSPNKRCQSETNTFTIHKSLIHNCRKWQIKLKTK
jgi:hypothetical protein